MKGLPFDPAQAAQAQVRCAANGIGFVYASAEIAGESTRRDRIEDSKRAEKAGFNLAECLQMHPCTAGDLDQERSRGMASLVAEAPIKGPGQTG